MASFETSSTAASSHENNIKERGSRKRTRLQYPQLALQPHHQPSAVHMALPDMVDSSAAITPGRNDTNLISSSKARQEKNSPLSPNPNSATVPVEPSSSSRSNPPSSYTKAPKKSGPPPNNTTIHDFFKSSMKARSPQKDNSPQKDPNSSPKPISPPFVSASDKVQRDDGATTGNTSANQQTTQQMGVLVEQMRQRCETLEQTIKEKDLQLQTVQSNRTILHTSLKSALEKKEQELQDLRRTMEERLGAMEKVLEYYIRKDKALELKELRHSLASNSARLGRFVYTRTLHGTVESWESGEAMMALKRQREELKIKREILEQRQKDAKKASKRVMKEQQQHTTDSMPPPPPVTISLPSNGENAVGGLLVQDELDAMEAEESVKMHLNTIKQQELKLAEDEKVLNAETAAHIRSLKRLANEDDSRFRKISKVSFCCTMVCIFFSLDMPLLILWFLFCFV